MSAAAYDAPVLHDKDLVRVQDGRDTLRHDDHGAVAGLLAEGGRTLRESEFIALRHIAGHRERIWLTTAGGIADRVITGELPVTAALADETFLMAPRFEGKCDELIAAYGEVYHKLAKNIDALKKLDAEAVDTAPKTMKGNSINLL